MSDTSLHPPAYRPMLRDRACCRAIALSMIAAVLLSHPSRAAGQGTESSPHPRLVPLLRTGHAGPVTVIVCSPEGGTFVTSSEDGPAILWDVSLGEKRGSRQRFSAGTPTPVRRRRSVA